MIPYLPSSFKENTAKESLNVDFLLLTQNQKAAHMGGLLLTFST